MLTRILAFVAVLLLAPSTLAHAHARALSLESASLGFFTPNRDFLKEIPDLTHCCIKEKSTEQSESSNRREEYLRARYMDPSQGRFLGMDPWGGCVGVPPSLHRFGYVLNEPIGFADPSGLEATLVGEGIAARIRASLTLGTQSTFRLTLRKVGKEVVCVAVEEVVEAAVVEALSGGIYLLVDGDGLYGGQTNDFERRYREHMRNVMRKIERTVARFHFLGGRNDMRLLEQFFLDFFADNGHRLTNTVRSISTSGGSVNTKRLRGILSRMDFCK